MLPTARKQPKKIPLHWSECWTTKTDSKKKTCGTSIGKIKLHNKILEKSRLYSWLEGLNVNSSEVDPHLNVILIIFLGFFFFLMGWL